MTKLISAVLVAFVVYVGLFTSSALALESEYIIHVTEPEYTIKVVNDAYKNRAVDSDHTIKVIDDIYYPTPDAGSDIELSALDKFTSAPGEGIGIQIEDGPIRWLSRRTYQNSDNLLFTSPNLKKGTTFQVVVYSFFDGEIYTSEKMIYSDKTKEIRISGMFSPIEIYNSEGDLLLGSGNFRDPKGMGTFRIDCGGVEALGGIFGCHIHDENVMFTAPAFGLGISAMGGKFHGYESFWKSGCGFVDDSIIVGQIAAVVYQRVWVESAVTCYDWEPYDEIGYANLGGLGIGGGSGYGRFYAD